MPGSGLTQVLNALYHRKFPGRPAAGLGTGLIHFPGGHNSDLTHPNGFADSLRAMLGASAAYQPYEPPMAPA